MSSPASLHRPPPTVKSSATAELKERAERVVAARLLHGEVEWVRELVRLEDLQSWPCRMVYEAAVALRSAGRLVDPKTVYDQLLDTGRAADLGPNPALYLAELADADPSGMYLDESAARVREAAAARTARALVREFDRDVADRVGPVGELVGRLGQQLADIARDQGRGPDARFKWIASDRFAGGDFRPKWLVRHALVRGQPGTIAGPSKVLKTSIGLDLGVSVASGTPFLGTFAVPARARVAIVSGESGMHTLQETANRVCAARGLVLADLGGQLVWCETLPTFSDRPVMTEFAESLASLGVELVLIDPLYLCLGAVGAKNLFEMGAALRVVSEVLLKAGVTPVITHHANRQLTAGEPMELHHLAYSGLEQYARQFVLISRQKPYQGDGVHDVWVRIGGSAGHGGLLAVHVEEGTLNDDFGGRRWDVTVRDAGDAREDRAQQKLERARQEQQKADAEVLDAIDAEVQAGRPGATVSAIKTRYPNLSGTKVKEVLERLLDAELVEEFSMTKPRGKGGEQVVSGLRRVTRTTGIPSASVRLWPDQ